MEALSNEQETTFTLWGITEDALPLETISNDHIEKAILFEISEDTEDGTYPLVMHYVTLANRIEKNGASAWLNYVAGRNKLKIELSGVTIIRENKYDSKATIIFKEPIKMVLGKVGETLQIVEVSEFKGEFVYDWFWKKNGGRQNKIANGFEIYFNILEMVK